MAHPYQFNQLQERAAAAARETLTASLRAEEAMQKAYPVGAMIEMQHKPTSETIRLEVLDQSRHGSYGLGNGWLWCKNLTRWEPPFQANVSKQYHRFAVVSHPKADAPPSLEECTEVLTGSDGENRARFVERLAAWPKSFALYCIPPLASPTDTAIALAQLLTEQGRRVKLRNGVLHFEAGGRITIAKIKGEKDAYRHAGAEYQTLYITDARTFDEKAFKYLCHRLRMGSRKDSCPGLRPLAMTCFPKL